MCTHAHMLAAISWINTYMFHPPHEEWNICIYMVAATSHMYACVHSLIPQSWNMVVHRNDSRSVCHKVHKMCV